MLDFIRIRCVDGKKGYEIFPQFIVKNSKDLMIRGGNFYAIWNEKEKLWSTDQWEAIQMIDNEVETKFNEIKGTLDGKARALYLWDGDSGMVDKWHKYLQKQMSDNFHPLDENVIFANEETTRESYASKKLPYPIEDIPIPAYEEMISTLYSPEERHKIEWAIGSIIVGDGKNVQKFIVMYGPPKSGKSTILTIIEQLFAGYYSPFDARALGMASNVFALEAFKSNPLVAIQHDGDLSHIEDNTRLNSLVSHETMMVNEKFKSAYANKFNSFLFMGTNKPVKITDAKSGILRRLIDVSPVGSSDGGSAPIPKKRYDILKNRIKFELGGIAYHCKQVYLNDPNYYDDYIPISMLGATNAFYNFVLYKMDELSSSDGITLKVAWKLYKEYCDEAKINHLNLMFFKEEMKNYYKEFYERKVLSDGIRVWNYFSGFRHDKFVTDALKDDSYDGLLKMNETKSPFDIWFENCPAQYASENGTPCKKWSEVNTTLKDIDTSKVHYMKFPKEKDKTYIFVDFDLKDSDGNKSFEKNIVAASSWPKTYAELSKSGQGIHLYYIYNGDTSQLSRLYSKDIEIKVLNGNASLRRKLIKCNSEPIATISTGYLPLKEKKMTDKETIKTEQSLRRQIIRNLKKEIWPNTKPSMDLIFKILDDAYNSDLVYDVSDMKPDIFAFAANSSHQSDYCIKLMARMKFASKKESGPVQSKNDDLIFYDVEVFPNLFIVVCKKKGEDPVSYINPSKETIEFILEGKLVGFNCRRYDNHIMYARLMGYSNEQLYRLSQDIIKGRKDAFFKSAYNLSYTDVYDFCSVKQSLKKWEIALGIHHHELGLPWDQPVPEELWDEVAEYCKNDVVATEAVFNDRQPDFVARQILADLSGMTVNDTTNSLSGKIIFGDEKNPQKDFVYTDLSEMFPGYYYDRGRSFYRGEETGEGGYVYAEPGIYEDIALLDIASMHPSSIEALNLFGPYTKIFSELKLARILIKHKNYAEAGQLFGGRLARYLKDDSQAKDLASALKIVINSVYGLTSAKFDNLFRDPRNVDNIVAKRGALFMINLKHEVQERGFTVAHIKTDSIKIPNATPEIIQFVMDYGKQYGYSFEHEATYERMCLVNDAVYIAKYKDGDWTATGTQFQIPYVFKKLFSKEPIIFGDLCETKTVSTALYLDFNEEDPNSHSYKFVGKAGQFCPILPGYGGGILLRESNNGYSAATGTKGYRWLESEVVRNLNMQDAIDLSYYEKLVDDAIKTISKYGDFDEFAPS